MSESFDCPNCGAPVPLDDDPPATVRCPHCSTTVIVPERLRRRPEPIPLVIRIGGEPAAPAVSRRAGRAIGIAVGAVVILSLGVALVGLLAGVGAAVAPFAIPAAVPQSEPGPLLSFGGEGIGPGLFTDARSIGLDGDGRVYVGEYQGGRIQVFTPEGKFVTQWFADREFPLTGMAVARDGSVYTVQRGELLRRDGMSGEAGPPFDYEGGQHFEDVAVQTDGGLVTGWYLFQDYLIVFDSAGTWVRTIPEVVSGQTGDSELSLRVAADGRGDLLALGLFNSAVFRYDAAGRFVNRFGSTGDEPGQFQAPMSITVDGQGRVYVGDIWGVAIFDRDGRFLTQMKIEGVPFGLAFDNDGFLWIVNGTQVMMYAVDLE
jgi:DNA-directed RNA polymerase subunit RPC12/RpoP